MSSGRERKEEEQRWLDSEVWTAKFPDLPELEMSAAGDGGVEAENAPAPPREEEGDGAAGPETGKGAGGGDPSLKDVYELLRSCLARLDGARKEDEDRLAGELKKLSGIAGKLTRHGEESRTLLTKMTGAGAEDGMAWKAAAERFEEAIRVHSEDLGRWVKGERSRRRRLPALALAVARRPSWCSVSWCRCSSSSSRPTTRATGGRDGSGTITGGSSRIARCRRGRLASR